MPWRCHWPWSAVVGAIRRPRPSMSQYLRQRRRLKRLLLLLRVRWRRLLPAKRRRLSRHRSQPCGPLWKTRTVHSPYTQDAHKLWCIRFWRRSASTRGVDIRVKYAGSATTAAMILEEGDNTPADVVFLQDPGSLGALSSAGMLDQIPQETLDKVDPRFRARGGEWVGTLG